MSVPACRDARCDGTLFLSDARVADNTPTYLPTYLISQMLDCFYVLGGLHIVDMAIHCGVLACSIVAV